MRKDDILRIEFIGKEIELTESTNIHNIGINGKIIDETKSSFLVQTKKGNKRLMKNTITFKTKINNKEYEIQGMLLQKRPHERIKLRIK